MVLLGNLGRNFLSLSAYEQSQEILNIPQRGIIVLICAVQQKVLTSNTCRLAGKTVFIDPSLYAL